MGHSIDGIDAAEVNAKTCFKKLKQWNSMQALLVIAMVDEDYEVTINGDDIKSSETVEDLYYKVAAKTH